MIQEIMTEGLTNPVVIFMFQNENDKEDMLKAAADMGALIFDGLCDGIFLLNQGKIGIEG